MKPRAGFSLIELLVTMALLAVVLLLLFRGFVAVSDTVSAGQRATALQRTLENARRVMEEDLSMMVFHPRWPIRVSSGAEEGPVLAFLRAHPGIGGETETEWVQYWRVARAGAPRVEQWVRYAGPADNRHDITRPDWWATVTTNQLSGEIVLDALLRAEIEVRLESGEVWDAGWSTERPAMVDVRLAATLDPLPPLAAAGGTLLQRVRQEDGGWIQFRVRPAFDPGPAGEL